MENRTILAIFLCLGIMISWTLFFAPKAPVPAEGEDGRTTVSQSRSPAEQAREPVGAAVAKPVEVPSSKDAPKVPAAPEVETVVENPGVFRAVFTSKGGRVKSFKLLDPQFATEAGGDQPMDLVDAERLGPEALPAALVLEKDVVLTGEEDFRLKEQTAEGLTYVWTSPDGRFQVEKQFAIHPESYRVELDITLTNLAENRVSVKPHVTVSAWRDPESTQSRGFMRPGRPGKSAAGYINDSLERKDIKDIREGIGWHGQVSWVGVDEQYFLRAVYPRQSGLAEASFSTHGDNVMVAMVGFPTVDLEQGEEATYPVGLYFGPKELSSLEAIGHDLDASVNFWIVGILARPMLGLMRLFQSWVGNWGIAILMLTVVVKVVLFPWTQKSFRSMKEMQRLKPKMDEMKAKYADDKVRQNQEMMALFKTHKVSPLGGCLPMLLQLPVWIALYRTIYSAVELYHANLGLWIHDLSAPDPFFVLPLLLGVIMFVQQRMTPSTMDAAQAKMMQWMMPIMFTGFMLFLPSGLVLYILANSVLTIGQQWLINRRYSKTALVGAAG